MQVIILHSPGREQMLADLMKELKGLEVEIIDDLKTYGRENFWQRWEQARQICLRSKHDDYLILHDDCSEVDLDEIRLLFKKFKNQPFVCAVKSDDRTSCWDSVPNRLNDFQTDEYKYHDFGFFDCCGISNRATFSKFRVDAVPASWFKQAKSSGVGAQLTKKFAALKIPMLVSSPSLAHHGAHDSTMHPEERKAVPLVAVSKAQKVVVGIATFGDRGPYLEKTLESLKGQCDEIVIYDNEQNPNLADNGKFWALQNLKPNTYFFACDDDIVYPESYVQDMIREINRHQCIVTHHGRILQGLDRSYYRGHQAYAFKQPNQNTQTIDVAGTGVTAWNTNYFHPKSLHKAKDLRMADLVFSLEAAKQGKKIIMPQRPLDYFTAQDVPVENTIYGMENRREERQIQLANEIWKLKHPKR
jgi:hypothetical protein